MSNARSTSCFTSGQYSSPAEERAKYEAFKKSLQTLDDLNAHERAINGTAVYGVNIFSDLSFEEFKANYLGTKIPANYASNRRLMQVAPAAAHTTATTADWRGIYTTPVKYQGSCGSCWYACTRLSILTRSHLPTFFFVPHSYICHHTSFHAGPSLPWHRSSQTPSWLVLPLPPLSCPHSR
jgi:C1A family cysteine protease